MRILSNDTRLPNSYRQNWQPPFLREFNRVSSFPSQVVLAPYFALIPNSEKTSFNSAERVTMTPTSIKPQSKYVRIANKSRSNVWSLLFHSRSKATFPFTKSILWPSINPLMIFSSKGSFEKCPRDCPLGNIFTNRSPVILISRQPRGYRKSSNFLGIFVSFPPEASKSSVVICALRKQSCCSPHSAGKAS